VSADDLPLPALLDEDEGGSPVESLDLAVLGYAGEGVVSVDDARVLTEHTARGLAEAEAHRGNALGCRGQELGKILLGIKSIGNMIEHLEVIGEHIEDGFDVLVIECIGELLSQGLNLLHTHRNLLLFAVIIVLRALYS
jgi:hypothetical protein